MIIALSVSACGSSEITTAGGEPAKIVQGSEVNVNGNGNSISGNAGPSWSDEELRSNAFGALCGTKKVTDLDIQRDANGAATFTGTCG